jgi:uncharacterized membrane protein YcjF (UPF0283 family)
MVVVHHRKEKELQRHFRRGGATTAPALWWVATVATTVAVLLWVATVVTTVTALWWVATVATKEKDCLEGKTLQFVTTKPRNARCT